MPVVLKALREARTSMFWCLICAALSIVAHYTGYAEAAVALVGIVLIAAVFAVLQLHTAIGDLALVNRHRDSGALANTGRPAL